MENIINKLKLKKDKQGFTLVELLVVIAILAVLASVSVVGYLGFTTKAKQSNARTEITQLRELIRGELIDGKEHTYTYKKAASSNSSSSTQYTTAEDTAKDSTVTFKYGFETTNSSTNYTLAFTLDNPTENDSGSSILKGSFTDLSSLKGEIIVCTSSSETANTESTLYTISEIYYKTDGVYAKWTIKDDSISDEGTSISSDKKDFSYTTTNQTGSTK